VKVADLLPSALTEARSVDPEVAATLLGFAQRATVGEDDDTPTLSIAPEGLRYRVRVNPGFCAEQVRDRRDALAVLAHELLHAFRGHFELSPVRDPLRRQLQNMALDVGVNAVVWARFVPQGAGIFARLYPAGQFPACLLRPPVDLLASLAPSDPTAARLACLSHAELVEVWQPGSAQRPRLELAFRDHYAGLDRRHPDALARLHLDGWLLDQEPQGYWDRFRRLVEAELGRSDESLEEILLLGDHEAPHEVGRGLPGGPPGLGALRAARQVVAPSKVPPKEARRFFAQVRRLAEDDPTARTPGRRSVVLRSVVPRPGRRELAALALGKPPSFYRWTNTLDVDDAAGIRVYLDVSGSTSRVQALFLGLAATLGRALAEPAWAWSTGEPVPLTRDEIHRGEFRTRYGTDFAEVLEHALRRRFRRLLVMTDGEFPIPPGIADRARRAALEVTFLLDDPSRSPFVDRAALEQLGTIIDVPSHLA
jgi:hypothetical protein